MSNAKIDVNGINIIVKKVIEEIGSSKEQIFQIVDSIRSAYENLKQELVHIKDSISKVIDEADSLEKQDKLMRKKLAEVSRDFGKYSEVDIKTAYEQASDIRVKLISKQNEEKKFKRKKNPIRIGLKKNHREYRVRRKNNQPSECCARILRNGHTF